MLEVQDCQALMALCHRHFLRHPLFPSIIWENSVPVQYLYETETEIHCRAVREFLDFSMKLQNSCLFRYLWSNWLHPFHWIPDQWDLISVANCDTVPYA